MSTLLPSHLRAHAVAQTIRAYRAVGIAKRPRARLARPQPPKAIARSYGAALRGLVDRLRPMFDAALAQLRPLVERARAERHDGFNPDQPRDEHGRFGEGGGGDVGGGRGGAHEVSARLSAAQKAYKEADAKDEELAARERAHEEASDQLEAAVADAKGEVRGSQQHVKATKRDLDKAAGKLDRATGKLNKTPEDPDAQEEHEEAREEHEHAREEHEAAIEGLREAEREHATAIVTHAAAIEQRRAPTLALRAERRAMEHQLNKVADELADAEDAERDARLDAGEGAAARVLIARLRQQFSSALSSAAVESLARRFANETTSYQRGQFVDQVRGALGADVFIADSRVRPLVESMVDANVGYVTHIGDRLANDLEAATLAAVQNGRLWPDLADDLEKKFGFAQERAQLIARDQVGKLYADVDQARQRELGVTKFIWRTVHDSRVRPEHADWDGQTFEYANPPEGDDGPELPGDAILCRCAAEPVYDDILGMVE